MYFFIHNKQEEMKLLRKIKYWLGRKAAFKAAHNKWLRIGCIYVYAYDIKTFVKDGVEMFTYKMGVKRYEKDEFDVWIATNCPFGWVDNRNFWGGTIKVTYEMCKRTALYEVRQHIGATECYNSSRDITTSPTGSW